MCCPRVWDKSFSEHFDVETELSHWVKTEHSNTYFDINIHSSTTKEDDGLFKILTLTSVINNQEVDFINSNSGLKAQRKIERVIDRMGFVNKIRLTEVPVDPEFGGNIPLTILTSMFTRLEAKKFKNGRQM